MAKNQFSKNFKAKPDKEKWNKICPPMEYRVISGTDAYSLGIVPTGMTSINTVVIGASGSTAETIMYFANYFRIDGTEIDQEPYFELYESGATHSSLYGIFHHANFDGRTETLNTNELFKISASGSTADIQFTAKPDKSSGTLDELRTQGKISGFEYTWGQGMKKNGAK
ncbi:hypothetical protein LNQ49_02560 [Flavobacterium sp. F-65]|uniref:Type VI secretion system secreted protein Hcp n=1 Tax=Flavobacterium pisciphilum TaxID=2893755 RepID=A0ABS8MNY4_9FLAO|nr:hypothetical protein [Flavobacterium sp. F-65]MCC9070482.1 hypothetical protein [Flavobacterium sp. F-65]